MLIFISLIRWFNFILFSIFSFPISSSLTFSLVSSMHSIPKHGQGEEKVCIKEGSGGIGISKIQVIYSWIKPEEFNKVHLLDISPGASKETCLPGDLPF